MGWGSLQFMMINMETKTFLGNFTEINLKAMFYESSEFDAMNEL